MPRTPHVSLEEAADRVSAYVYGNILLLAALVVLSEDDVDHGTGIAIVVGTAVSTFVAHAFSESLGSAVRGGEHSSWRTILRDSVPILSAATVPTGLMVIGTTDLLPPVACLRLAEAWIVSRMALTAFFVGRLQGRPVTFRTWLASAALAGSALAVVAIKVVLTH